MAEGRRLRGTWLAGGAALSLVVTVQNLRDPDVWWHLAIGRLIAGHGIPSAEPFSFLTPAHPWVGQQWLYELGLWRLVDLGGPGAASAAMGVLATLALTVAALAVPRPAPRPGPWIALCLFLSALVAGEVLGVRGQVITVAGVAAELFVLHRWRQGDPRPVWALPPLLLLWCNLHAGFVVGLLLPLVVAAVHRPGPDSPAVPRRPLLIATAAAAAATLVNPAGPGLYAYVAQTFGNPTLTHSIVEWMSPDFHQTFPRLLIVEALLLVGVWLAAPQRPEPVDLVLAGGAFAATLQAQRNVALFAVIALPQLIRYGGAAWSRRRPPEPRPSPRAGPTAVVAAAALAAGALAAVLPTLSRTSADRLETAAFPRGAVEWARAHLGGHRLYAQYEAGGYIANRSPQGRVVFIYGESAVFGDAGLQRYLDIHLLRPGWPAALDRAGMRDAVLPAQAPEVSALREIGWTVDCHDDASGSVVLSRRPPAPPPGDRPPAC